MHNRRGTPRGLTNGGLHSLYGTHMAGTLTHFNAQGDAHMVDVGAKDETHRMARADSFSPSSLRVCLRGPTQHDERKFRKRYTSH